MQTIVPHLLARCEDAVISAEGLLAEAKAQVRDASWRKRQGGFVPRLIANSAPRMGWPGSPRMSKRCVRFRVGRVRWSMKSGLAKSKCLIVQAAFGEYLAQLAGGIAMSQNEIVAAIRFGHR